VNRDARRIGLNMAALVVSRFLSLALALVQTAIIMRALGPVRGHFGFSLQFAALFTVFATFGTERLLIRDIARNPGVAWTLVWTAEAVVLVCSGVVFLVLAGILLAMDIEPALRAATLWAAVSVVVLWAVQRPFEALLTARERMEWVALANLAAAVLKVAFVWFLMRHHPTTAMAHAAIAAANLAGLALCAGFAIRVAGFERPRVRLGHALTQMRDCLPFVAAMIFSSVYFKADMSLLQFIGGDAATYVYTPVQRVMEPLLMIAGIWGVVVFPALCRFSVAGEGEYERLKRTSSRLALLGAFPMAFGVAVLAGPILFLVTGESAADSLPSARVLQVLALVVPFFYLNGVGQEFFYASHRNGYVVGAYAIAAAVSVAANLAVIPRHGAFGSAWVAVGVNALITVLFVAGMRREYAAMRLGPLVLKTLIACLVMGAGAWALASWSLFAAVAAGILLYAAAQLTLGTLDPNERDVLRRMALGLLRRRAG
jgi:O-antigen/teichoic acid export membrane protein